MIVSIIVAMDEKRGIGLGNRLPWHLSADLKRFKALTTRHHVILGRKTFESIGRLLPGRVMIIVTRQPNYHPSGCIVARSLQEALELAAARGEEEVFVIGGGAIFAEALKKADKIYLTVVHTRVEADTFFPPIEPQEWDETTVAYHPPDVNNDYPSTFSILVRKKQFQVAEGSKVIPPESLE